jgi:hypothetical protein
MARRLWHRRHRAAAQDDPAADRDEGAHGLCQWNIRGSPRAYRPRPFPLQTLTFSELFDAQAVRGSTSGRILA